MRRAGLLLALVTILARSASPAAAHQFPDTCTSNNADARARTGHADRPQRRRADVPDHPRPTAGPHRATSATRASRCAYRGRRRARRHPDARSSSGQELPPRTPQSRSPPSRTRSPSTPECRTRSPQADRDRHRARLRRRTHERRSQDDRDAGHVAGALARLHAPTRPPASCRSTSTYDYVLTNTSTTAVPMSNVPVNQRRPAPPAPASAATPTATACSTTARRGCYSCSRLFTTADDLRRRPRSARRDEHRRHAHGHLAASDPAAVTAQRAAAAAR